MIKTHTFNGRKYHIILDDLDGFCNTATPELTLGVGRDLNERVGLETAIHESLHACSWKASESAVTNTAYDIARFLWRLGFRKMSEIIDEK